MRFVSCVSLEWGEPCVPVVSSTLPTPSIMKKSNKGAGANKKKTTKEVDNKEAKSLPTASPSLEEEDQGFGGWLRSPDGLETMKLFVVANSIIMLTTIVYPHVQNVYGIITDMLYGDDEYA